MQDLITSYRILQAVYQKGAFASLELSNGLEKANNKEFVTKLIYGVLERNIELDYYVEQLTSKRPKPSIVIIIKMGMYIIKYLDSVPDYAAVSNMVNLAEKIGKRELKGFINATLKKFITWGGVLPDDDLKALSVKYSAPAWIVQKYIEQYGKEKTQQILEKDLYVYEHIRVNKKTYSMDQLMEVMKEFKLKFDPSLDNAIYTKYKKILKNLFNQGKITLQSKTSMICAEMLEVKDGDQVLDLCAAPGGKSVYLSEIANCFITACDIHEHRLDLIRSYVYRMGCTKINVLKNDALLKNDNFQDKFDKVLCDVPCSGLGVSKKKPDIYLSLTYENILDLASMQKRILDNAKLYVKVGGTLIYSTCTLLKEENQDIVKEFKTNNSNFELLEEKQFLPIEAGIDGFYIAKFRRIR